jgi:hypothetical protein
MFKKGHTPWNKGLKVISNTGRTYFKKGSTPWNKGKKLGPNPEHSKRMKGRIAWNKGKFGEESNSWKGDSAGYKSKHQWIERRLGKPDTCEHCGKSGLKGPQIHWANIDHKYIRILEDWVRLCAKCHVGYDRGIIIL